jgi:Cu(I)/Ag(I) efflux system membrane protein CusA/SilA
MLERLIEYSAKNRFLIILLTILVAGGGIWATYNTPVDAIPDLSDVQVIVKTEYPGQGPKIVEEQVTYPLATSMLSVPYAKTVRGYSMFGTSFVYVIFEEGTDMYWARSRVLEYLNQVTGDLPEGAKPALGPDATGVGWVYQYSLIDTTGNHDLAQLRSIQDFFLKYELQGVEGVSEIASVGGFQKEYQVVVDPQKLAGYGIPLRRVKMALKESNKDVGGRILEIGGKEFIVRGKGYLKGAGDIEEVVLKADRGSPVTIGDVATVQLGPEIRRGIADKNGKGEVVGGIVVMRYGENAMATIQRVKARIAELEASLPEGVQIAAEYDRSALIGRAVDTLSHKIWEELAVVAFIVILFLLHVRSAFVALVTVPVGILISMLVMYLLGINANIMSLGGLAIALGAMVDASLVMVEDAHKHIERAKAELGRDLKREERIHAVLAAAKEVGPSLFFALVIVTVSFLPVFALGGMSGRMFEPLALTKTFAMAASSILAVTLVPALMVIFVKGKIRPEAKNPVAQLFIRSYRPIIRGVLRHPLPVLAGALVILGLTFLPIQRMMWGEEYVPFPQVGSEFMPPLDEGDLLYMPTTLPGVSPREAKELLQRTDRIIASFPEVENVFGKIGRANTATDPAPLSMIETVIQLKPKDQWREGMTKDKLIAEMDQSLQFPGMTNAWTMPIKTRIDMLATGIKTPVGIKVGGADIKTLENIGKDIERALNPVEGTLSVYAERVMGGSFLDIDINRREAARHGLTTGDVQDVITSAIGGMNVTTTVEGLERYSVNVRYPRGLRDNLPALRNALVPAALGAQVPMGQLAAFNLVEGPPMIKSEQARPNAWVFVDLEDGQDVGSYVQRAKTVIDEQIALPAGYSLTWSGQYQYMQEANKRLQLLVPITIMIIFLLLFLHFRSLTETLILMLTLPFAAVGGIWLIALLGFNWSIAVGVGVIAVAGLAVEMGIVMVVYLEEALRRYEREGRLTSREALRSAIQEGSLLRVRPILMTALAMFIGLLPIMFGGGTGSEVMQRIAAPMVGGLFSAAVLTLVVIPALYMVVKAVHHRKTFQAAGNGYPGEETVPSPAASEHEASS